ncbi:hypothetical protein EPN44_05475 [bacterium]|nr:MAG: hypothetical protein EPN44_05475 [bacterium]
MRRAPDPRPGWARMLLIAAAVLLISIEAGRLLGFRILAKAVEQIPVVPVVRYTPHPQDSLAPFQVRNWKSDTIVRVAPDPRFPDPHVTAPPPPPPPTPQPVRTAVPPSAPTRPSASPAGTGGATTGASASGLSTPPLETPPTPLRNPNAGP